MRALILLALLLPVLLAGCGGGGGADDRLTVAFYGDSITAGQVERIARRTFRGIDYAVGGQHSDAPLHPDDTAPVVVLRYGMADAAHGLTPQETRENLLALTAQVRAQGRRPIVVNVSRTESGFEQPTNDAIADLTDIDVSSVPIRTLDGIHPDDESYERLNAFIHDALARLTG